MSNLSGIPTKGKWTRLFVHTVSWYESMGTSYKPGPGPDEEGQAPVMDHVQRGLDNHTDKDSERYRRELLCVQEVITPIYIITHYINWGNYLLETRYKYHENIKTTI